MKIKSSFNTKSNKFHISSSKSGASSIPLDVLTDLQQVLQESKIPSIFVSQLNQLISSKTKSNNSTRNSFKNDFKSTVQTMNFLGFQRKLTNYIQNSGLNRFTRDFDVKIKEMYGLTKRSMPNIARELLELNVYDKSINSFIHNFNKIRKHFENNFNNISSNSKKNSNSNLKKCQEIFDQISKQINSNEIILDSLKSLNSYINSANIEINNSKKEFYNSEYQNTENNNDLDNFSSPSIDDIIDSKNNNFNQTQLLTLSKYTNTSSTSNKINQEQIIQNEIRFLNEQRLALQTALELQQNMNELKSEICILTQTIEENELVQGLIEIEEEFLIESSNDFERVKTINESIHTILNGDSTVSTVDFDNIKLKSEVVKIENKIADIQQKMNFLAKKPIHNLPLLKKSKKLLKKQLNSLATDPIPPQLQKLKNDQLAKQILYLREENDKISIQRTEFDNFEVLSNYAKKCQNDYYQLKDVYEETLLTAQESAQSEEDDKYSKDSSAESSFNDYEYCRHLLSSNRKSHHHDSEGKSKKKPKNANTNQLKKTDILHLLRELQDEYSICMSNIERITNRKYQERLMKKQKFIKRQRSFLNDLLNTAYECSEELKESFEIEAELFEEASQRGIEVDTELSDIVFECMKKSEITNTIEEKCNEVAEMIEYFKNENRSKNEKEASYSFNNCTELFDGVKEIIEEKGEDRCNQLLRIFNLRKELEDAKNQK